MLKKIQQTCLKLFCGNILEQQKMRPLVHKDHQKSTKVHEGPQRSTKALCVSECGFAGLFCSLMDTDAASNVSSVSRAFPFHVSL